MSRIGTGFILLLLTLFAFACAESTTDVAAHGPDGESGVAAITQGLTYDGGDWGGDDLILSDGDILNGTFTNVGAFEVPSGATVFVANGVPLELHAETILIDGELIGDGAGSPGGAGGVAPESYGADGQGAGAGSGGRYGDCCVHPTGGGGGGYGGDGGYGANPFSLTQAPGGPVYGDAQSETSVPMGSGGGGGGSNSGGFSGNGGDGGNGGGSIALYADTITVSGALTANGQNGQNGTRPDTYGAAGGGGGSGGTLLLHAISLDVTGSLEARGGNGGWPSEGVLLNQYSGGGGGGAGGRIKIFYGVSNTFAVSTDGGIAAPNGSVQASGGPAQDGASGTEHREQLGPVATASPDSLDFGDIRVATTSAPETVTLENSGVEAFTVDAITVSGPFLIDGIEAGDTVPAGDFVEFEVFFAPTASGGTTGSVVIDSDATNSPTTVTLAGNGIEPVASAAPVSLDFGPHRVGTTSGPETVTLENTGTDELIIANVSVSGPFDLTGIGPGDSLAPGASSTFEITFSPTSEGSASGMVTIDSDAANAPTTITLEGNGVEAVGALDPTQIDFGDIRPQTTSPAETVLFENTGGASLSVTSVQITGPFSMDGVQAGTVITAGSSTTFDVTFEPLGPGQFSGSVTIESDAANSPHILELEGTAIIPTLSTAAQLDFGTLAIAEEGDQSLSIANTGDDDLTIDALVISGDADTDYTFVDPPQLPWVIAAGASDSLEIRSIPSQRGARLANLTITSDSWESEIVTVELITHGEGPVIDVDATAIYLGTSNVGVRSEEAGVEVSNDGDRPLEISAVSFSGTNAAEFYLETVLPITIAPTESAILDFTFEPAALGSRTATAWIANNDTITGTVPVDLSGQGTSPSITTNPSSLYFGDVRVGTTAGPLDVDVENTGTGPLTMTDINLGAPFSVTAPAPDFIIEAGDTETLSVFFEPTSVGSASSVLHLESDDPDSPTVEIDVSGQGISPGISLSETVLDFGAQQVGRVSEARTVEVFNTGTDVLSIEDIDIVGSNSDGFELSSFGDLPLLIDVDESIILEVVFHPQAVTAYSAELQIESDAPEAAISVVTLTGVGLSEAISATPLQINFGPHRAPVTTALPRAVEVTNHGSDALAMEAPELTGPSSGDFEVGAFVALIDPGQTVEIEVNYVAEFTADSEATLVLAAVDAAVPSVEVRLAGQAFGGALTASPTSLDFGTQFVAELSDALEVTLINIVSHDVEIEDIIATDEAFQVHFDGPITLPAGEELTFDVRFYPTEVAEYSGRVEVYLTGIDAPETAVNVEGMGQDPPVDGHVTGGGCACTSTPGGAPVWPVLLLAIIALVKGRGIGREFART